MPVKIFMNKNYYFLFSSTLYKLSKEGKKNYYKINRCPWFVHNKVTQKVSNFDNGILIPLCNKDLIWLPIQNFIILYTNDVLKPYLDGMTKSRKRFHGISTINNQQYTPHFNFKYINLVMENISLSFQLIFIWLNSSLN